tara:strand:+ start:2358 stop:3128 length:771 start_codon:yes stop_codon:yes gene_type:complete
MSIEIKNISYAVKDFEILKEVSLKIKKNEIFSLLGPNGSGKSTLLRVVSGDIQPNFGTVKFDDTMLDKISIIDRARIRSVMSQSQEIIYDFSVKEVIEMGWLEGKEFVTEKFDNALIKVGEECKISHLFDKSFNQLSGGEKRKVHFARTLIQMYNKDFETKSRYIMLDEPTANLDISHELQLIKILKKKSQEGFGIFIILHDLNLAYHFSDKVAFIKKGKIHALGTPNEVYKEEILSDVYDLDVSFDKTIKKISYY